MSAGFAEKRNNLRQKLEKERKALKSLHEKSKKIDDTANDTSSETNDTTSMPPNPPGNAKVGARPDAKTESKGNNTKTAANAHPLPPKQHAAQAIRTTNKSKNGDERAVQNGPGDKNNRKYNLDDDADVEALANFIEGKPNNPHNNSRKGSLVNDKPDPKKAAKKARRKEKKVTLTVYTTLFQTANKLNELFVKEQLRLEEEAQRLAEEEQKRQEEEERLRKEEEEREELARKKREKKKQKKKKKKEKENDLSQSMDGKLLYIKPSAFVSSCVICSTSYSYLRFTDECSREWA